MLFKIVFSKVCQIPKSIPPHTWIYKVDEIWFLLLWYYENYNFNILTFVSLRFYTSSLRFITFQHVIQ